MFIYLFLYFVFRVGKPDYMSLEIKTDAQNGLILWQGQVSSAKLDIISSLSYLEHLTFENIGFLYHIVVENLAALLFS